jgi:probable HAF family extracellular repeat protein
MLSLALFEKGRSLGTEGRSKGLAMSQMLTFALLLALASPPAAAETYSVIDLGSLGSPGCQAHGINASGQVTGEATTAPGQSHGFIYSGGGLADLGIAGTIASGRAINSSGQIAGYYYDRSYQAFLWDRGKTRDLGDLGGRYAAAYALNSAGHVCGSSFTRANREHAFFWGGRRMIDLGTLGGERSSARGINTADQVVGYAYLASGGFHAFVWGEGAMKDLGTLGGDYSSAYAINDAGQIVGQASTGGNAAVHAALWSGGSVQDLGDLGSGISAALAIDSRGTQIVGSAEVPSTSGFVAYHAFVWSGGVMKDLNDLIPQGSGWVLQEADGINDAGQIIGWGSQGGEVRGFLLQPATTTNALVAADPAAVRRGLVALGRLTLLDLRNRSANPARTGAELEYSLQRAGFVTLRVMDVSGRTVRTLAAGDFPAGTHVVPWDLSDHLGRRVTSGNYFVRLNSETEARTVRMSVVR